MEALGTLASTPASEESPAAAQQDAENTPARSPTLAPSATTRLPTVPVADNDKTALLDRAAPRSDEPTLEHGTKPLVALVQQMATDVAARANALDTRAVATLVPAALCVLLLGEDCGEMQT